MNKYTEEIRIIERLQELFFKESWTPESMREFYELTSKLTIIIRNYQIMEMEKIDFQSDLMDKLPVCQIGLASKEKH
ncbi:MAG TPA: hypothetical protein VK255_00200 [Patescibacteria group bacterium]|nr:hypothetical protein [Patescibacteria group bacterium]